MPEISPNDTPYTNREIREFLSDINEKLGRIEVQTTKTNGRVRALELYKFLLIGGGGIIAIIVLPLMGYTFQANAQVVQNQISQINHTLNNQTK